jgi:myo-inositol-hexaphosphate 3-phosphohydrolase
LIFINDLPECVTSRTCLFADDAIVYREIRSDQDCDKLQNDLLALAKWEELWGMSFHPDKCNVLRVVKSKKPRMYKYHLKGHQLEAADTTKYLGVDLTCNLSWNHHIDRTVQKGNSIRVITKLPNSEQSYKGKVKTHNYINRQNQSTTGKL